MLLDVSLISPVKEGVSSEEAKRRRRERERNQKVLPRRQSHETLKQDDSTQSQGRALNAYA